MASIFGVTAKKIVKYSGHEGEVCCRCDIYIDDIKAGTFEEDTWGGPARLDFSADMIKTLNERSAKYFAKYPERYEWLQTPDIMIYELLFLYDKEKIFKKAKKEGYKAIGFVLKGNQTYVYKYPAALSENEIIKDFDKHNISKKDRFLSQDDFDIK